MDRLDREVNKNSWMWNAPDYFSKWRVFPRAFIMVYFWLIIQTAMWFMGLPAPSPAQAAFASAVIGAGAAWFGLYVNSGNNNINHYVPPPSRRPGRPAPDPRLSTLDSFDSNEESKG